MKRYELFLSFFSFQIGVTVTAYMLNTRTFGLYHFYAMACMLLGRALWERERKLWETESCPIDADDIDYWLHSMWHVFSALGHYYWLKGLAWEWSFTRELPDASTESGERKEKRHNTI